MGEDRDRLTGGCQCGAVRYALSAAPEGAHLCHCRMCQKAMGNVFAALAPVRLDAFAWTRGEPAIFASSSIAERGFCPRCGTPLTFRYLDSECIEVTIGSLDHPELVPPGRHYGTESRVPWLHVNEDLPGRTTEENITAERKAKLESRQHPDRDAPTG